MEKGLVNYKWEAKKKVLKWVVPIVVVILGLSIGITTKNYIDKKVGYHNVTSKEFLICNKCSGNRIHCKDVILGRKKDIFKQNELIEMYRCRDCNYKWIEPDDRRGTVSGIMTLFYSTSNDEINAETNELDYNNKHKMK